ncbi:MAG: prepilin-type N-terminal cleavage/methylation domain-containing protein [Planctomycetota bacterium]
MRFCSRRQRGFSLLEAAVAILLVVIAVPATLSALGRVASLATIRVLQQRALRDMWTLMGEIESRSFEDPQLPPGSFGREESQRNRFDDVDDYDGLVQKIANSTGVIRVAVRSVSFTNLDAVAGITPGATDLKRIDVWAEGIPGDLELTAVVGTLGRD